MAISIHKYRERPEPLPNIELPYLMVSGIPLIEDSLGVWWIDYLWFKDLKLHLEYLSNFTLACPIQKGIPPAGAVPFNSHTSMKEITVIPLPFNASLFQSIVHLPRSTVTLTKAIKKTTLVHLGFADWPLPYGWIALPIAKYFKKYTLVVIESTFWRVNPGTALSLLRRIRSVVWEKINQLCVAKADFRLFTHEGYRDQFQTTHPERNHVIPASWIDEEIILCDEEAKKIWKTKSADTQRPLELLYAGRLIDAKGVWILLDSMQLLKERGIAVNLNILGNGPLLDPCKKAVKELASTITIKILGTLPYGPPLFDFFRLCDAIIIPSLSEEQPRLVFDAYSQGLPVLGSNTTGIRSCVTDGKTGRLVPPGDPTALADLISWASLHHEKLYEMGKFALAQVRLETHRNMHRTRHKLILNELRKSSTIAS